MPGYSKRLPRSLLVSLKPDRCYYVSKKRLLRDLKPPVTMSQDETLLGFLEALIYEGESDKTWVLVGQCEVKDAFASVVKIAAEAGDLRLTRMLAWTGRNLCLAYLSAGLNEHWDVFDLLIRRLSGRDLFLAISISPATHEYMRSRVTVLDPDPSNIYREAIVNRYRFGFDKEILDYFCKGTTEPILDGSSVLPAVPVKCHESAPETLRYLLSKYPNVIWTRKYIEMSLVFCEFTDPRVEREFKDILIAAGHPNGAE